MKTYSDSPNKYFGIGMSLYGNTDVIVENSHYVSIKFDDQTYDYPYPVRMGKSGWLIISEPETPELYYVMLNLLSTGKPFKIRLDEIVDAKISQLATSYVADIPTTNFFEAYTYCYGNG